MKTTFLVILICLFMAGCVEAGINFERMNEAELAAYNEGRSLSQMIVCQDGPKSFSRVRRRWCATVEQMYGSADAAAKLGVLSSGLNIGTGGSGF